MKEVITRAKKCNVKFNAEKVQYRVNKVKYLGHIISADGMVAISKLGHPKNKQDLQKLYGMINYVRNFVPNLSEISHPKRMSVFTGPTHIQNV